ncbi:MAG TPA: ankyrin repeat domain-containing protein [Longimicrobium sp.]|nr:ankyrin repeat domain-containing protein [Longimicrobium sp.]
MSPSHPFRPSLEQQKKQAKELLRALRGGDAAAFDRLRRWLPDKERLTLADAQFVLAREAGFASWPAFRSHLEGADDAIPPLVEAELRRAFAARDADAVRALLRRSPQARARIDAPVFPFDGTALGHFAGAGDLAMVEVLLENGADPNRRSDWWAGGFHPLHTATGVVADRLMAAGAVPDACAAAHLDRPDLLRRMLDADPARVHERGGDGQTPLHFARSREVVDLLLERGADLDARDVDHRATPAQWMLDRARGAGRYELARYLVARGASPDVFLAAALGLEDVLRSMLAADPSLLDVRTGQGEYGEKPPSSYHIYYWTLGPDLSPFQVASRFEQPGAMEVLRAFATPRQRFVAASAAARADEARRILRERPQLALELTPEDHRAITDAAWAPEPAAVALMLELGFDPATPGHDGGTALHCAAWQGSAGCVEALLRHPRGRALVGVRDARYGATPLGWCCHGAAHCGHPAAVHPVVARLLLDAGARPDPGWEDAPDAVTAVIRAHTAG